MKKFIRWVFLLVNPPMEEMQTDEAKKLLNTITSRFSIEEQSDIVEKLKSELITYREQEVEDTKKHLNRLAFDLIRLKATDNIE